MIKFGYVEFKVVLFVLMFLFELKLTFSQQIELVILDSITTSPIYLVHAYNATTQEGRVSNEEGKVLFEGAKAFVYLSHINYNFQKKFVKEKDTIWLCPISYKLDEIVVSTSKSDLKKILKRTLSNYDNIYIDSYFNLSTLFKEFLKVNNKYAKLMQCSLDWSIKDYELNILKSISKQSHLEVNDWTYSKSIDKYKSFSIKSEDYKKFFF